MIRKTLNNSLLALTAGLLIAGVAGARADTEHSTIIACYGSVDSQCNQAGGCSKEDKTWGYNQCDGYYANSSNSSSASTPKRTGIATIAGAKNNMRFRSAMQASFRR